MTAGPIRDRDHGAKARQGQERASARGVRIGRPRNRKLTPDVLERARAMLAAGMHIRQAAAALRVPRSTLHQTILAGRKSRDV